MGLYDLHAEQERVGLDRDLLQHQGQRQIRLQPDADGGIVSLT
jgi:hypothetical protein